MGPSEVGLGPGRRNNDQRAPLLLISGSDDNLMPPSVQRSNAKHYNRHGVLWISGDTVEVCSTLRWLPLGRPSASEWTGRACGG